MRPVAVHGSRDVRPVKVLLVEDEKKTSAFLRKGLSESGFVVDVAKRGDDGLDLALSGCHDIVVLDLMLPGRDG
jgi:two-component system copper resistance phosphate regulon response regulator CusR